MSSNKIKLKMMIGELEDDIHIEIEDELFEVMLEEGVMAKKKKKFMEWNYLFQKKSSRCSRISE